MREGWLLHEGDVVASALEGAGWAGGMRAVHDAVDHELAVVVPLRFFVATWGAPRPVDVALLDESSQVKGVFTLRPWRIARIPRGVVHGVIAPFGVFERTKVMPGDHLEFRPAA